VLAAAVVASTPVVAGAAPRHEAAPAQSDLTLALGGVYGGVTPQTWPVVVAVNDSHRKITRINIGIDLQCTSGNAWRVKDGYENVPINRGKFNTSFGPEPQNLDDGTTATEEGTASGKFNRFRTKVSGTWTFKVTFRDTAGTVTDTCDSGIVNWIAKN
jgi:hypothetical protein